MKRDGMASGPDDLIDTRPLFRPLHAALIQLLRSLDTADWERPAGAGIWTVRDVAAHLLDGDLRRISVDRDAHAPPPAEPLGDYADLLRYLNQLNAQWTEAARRISARLLVELLGLTGGLLAPLMERAEPHGVATFPVAWAGHQQSPMWLDVGREYTERWHHQDQIREAVGAQPLAEPGLLRPVIRISLFALPPALAGIERPDGTAISLTASGAAGGAWQVERRDGAWRIMEHASGAPAARIDTTDLGLARLLMHRLTAERGRELVRAEGDRELTAAILSARAVMV